MSERHHMGRGRGRGRGRRRVMNFLKPCLLFTLHQGEAHGYSLLDGLGEFGFDPELLDSSLVYRALRDMEENGWVISRWGEESQGPRRRVYQISPDGEARLGEWITDLRKTREEIDRLLAAYEQYVE
jgi:PadR family transcriptional regulator PadR